jgi:hypothetical protein
LCHVSALQGFRENIGSSNRVLHSEIDRRAEAPSIKLRHVAAHRRLFVTGDIRVPILTVDALGIRIGMDWQNLGMSFGALALHQALAEHQVLFFRDQPLDVGSPQEVRPDISVNCIFIPARQTTDSRGCETINAKCLATELLTCECVMRRPIASLCSAPMALGFDPDFDEGNVGTIVLSRDSMKK